jgi:hypothetical protein
MEHPPQHELPEWERGTPAVLCVAGPHPIPVTTPVRRGPDRVLLALGRRRETLERLRVEPRVALLVIGKGVAFTAHSRALVIAEELEATDTVVVVELTVERVQDHLADERTEMLDGARWRWCNEHDGEMEDRIVAELEGL